MNKKIIIILFGVGAVAVTTTAIAVPLSLKNDDHIIQGQIIKDPKVVGSKEYESFIIAFKAQSLGITDVLIDAINDENENLIVIVTGKNKTADVK